MTICLPLFLAGGEGDRAFAKFYPTIAIDGCEKRCAYRGTEKYSNTPAASIVITDFIQENGLGKPEGLRRLNEAGLQAVDLTADLVAEQVDKLLGKKWSRKEGQFNEPERQEEVVGYLCLRFGDTDSEGAGKWRRNDSGGAPADIPELLDSEKDAL